MTRDEDCLALAAAMPGWEFIDFGASAVFHIRPRTHVGSVGGGGSSLRFQIYIPAPDAPLPEQLEFVGRIAVGVGCERPRVVYGPDGWIVNYSDETLGESRDLAHAAVRAALAAKGAK